MYRDLVDGGVRRVTETAVPHETTTVKVILRRVEATVAVRGSTELTTILAGLVAVVYCGL